VTVVGCVAQLVSALVSGRRTFLGLRSTDSWRVTTVWVNRQLQVSQLGQLSLSSFCTQVSAIARCAVAPPGESITKVKAGMVLFAGNSV